MSERPRLGALSLRPRRDLAARGSHVRRVVMTAGGCPATHDV